ncbi:MAG TPA: Hsp70 family protein [Xanthobacteraceae bacterium]
MASLALIQPQDSSVVLPERQVRVLGIDLGTTNSTVAEIVWQPSSPAEPLVRCLEVEQETQFGTYTHILVPSAVALHDGKLFVGEGAKRLLAQPKLGFQREQTLFMECKNDMGVQRTYHKAPEGFRSAAEIGGKVLGFLKAAADAHDSAAIDRIVVTVPASFQAAQRLDTAKAANLAGIKIFGGDLLDEPVAAFFDYLMSHSHEIAESLTDGRTVVVFDFGGGTCDVALFRLTRHYTGSLQISPLAVSRYHRLGGGDIDRAILHEILLPQLLQQNGLRPTDLTFDDKKHFVEAAYLGVAEALKTGLCTEIIRLEGFGQYEGMDKGSIAKKQPGLHVCALKDRMLQLQSPSMSAAQFEEVLKPFLDRDLLYARETEYRLTCSIFAPLQDALDRSGLEAKDIDFCLPVGGSTLIPQVGHAIAKFFFNARVLTYGDRESVQIAVARGAAWQSLALALFGRSPIQVAAHDRMAIRTTTGAYELISKGSLLPYPDQTGWATNFALAVPQTSLLKPVDLLVEIVAGEADQERRLFTATWKVPAPVNKGDKLRLDYRLDENQVFEFMLTLADSKEAKPLAGRIENPLSNVVNPHGKRLKIQQAEEDLRTGKVPSAQIPDKVVAIARDYAELQQIEKAISYLQQALRWKNQPDPDILNLLGIYYGELGDIEKQEKCYRESFRVSNSPAALFNLALSQKRRRQFADALESIQSYLQREQDGPVYTLKAMVAEATKEAATRDGALRAAMECFGEPRSMSDWELGWYITATRMAGDNANLEAATAEQRRRKEMGQLIPSPDGQLPMISPALARTTGATAPTGEGR